MTPSAHRAALAEAQARVARLEKRLRDVARMEHDPRHHGGAMRFEDCEMVGCQNNAEALAPTEATP